MKASMLFFLVSCLLCTILTQEPPEFKRYSLSAFDKHKSYLPLYRGDYFSIEVFLHEKDHEWEVGNAKELRENNIIKYIKPEGNVNSRVYSNSNNYSINGFEEHIVLFDFHVNKDIRYPSFEELVFIYKNKKENKVLVTKTVNVKIIEESKKKDL